MWKLDSGMIHEQTLYTIQKQCNFRQGGKESAFEDIQFQA